MPQSDLLAQTLAWLFQSRHSHIIWKTVNAGVHQETHIQLPTEAKQVIFEGEKVKG
jgi:hypothetical protein